MNLIKKNGSLSAAQTLPIMIVFLLLSICTVRAESQQKSCDKLLFEIMDLHSDLVTDERFLAQAKMLGAYLEAAKSSDEPNRVEIYTKVLNILKKIKASSTATLVISEPNKAEATVPKKLLAKEKQGAPAKYIPGAALLEIFKTDSIDKVLDLVPVIRTYWKQNLACTWSGDPREWEKSPWSVRATRNYGTFDTTFLVPERYAEIGLRNPYIARFSFYYEAKQSGKYGFNIWHGRNACRLVIGGSIIAEDSSNPYNEQSTTQGVCNLEKGFHRVEFWLVSSLDYSHRNNAYFALRILTPDAFDAVLITKDMMLMKEEAGPPK